MVKRKARHPARIAIGAGAALLLVCAIASAETGPERRSDGASRIPIVLDGSFQNAAWSPSGAQIVFTRFRGRGYNKGPADILIFDLQQATVRNLMFDGRTNVTQPGSTWNARTDQIVFSSTRKEHDEIFTIRSDGRLTSLKQLTSDEEYAAYEPSMSPDGQSVVFESHIVGDRSNGVIRRVSVGLLKPQDITEPDEDEDCRQPNWSPAGDAIVYQKRKEKGPWDLWIYDLRSKEHRQLTTGKGDKTDATFSPDGHWVVYSADNSRLPQAKLFAINTQGGTPVQITQSEGYDGAPSWSPDGKLIIFESPAQISAPLEGEESGAPGASKRRHPPTALWTISVPESLRQRLCVSGAPCR
jgi:TolB protein